ncbi:hypothetical protein [Catenuloplanes atrovinosus]|uniref:Uncharacterized protein n=1 Tax=Catenuloplanes atrovinosus TaxID=137266 RepID=A0AAE3YWB7_9ACTN|nr:hypothetical protein [Catenuloplanes atrovinosus]MDR7279811.1 hypothetical protein [Catenuloplanes atrovinosus]
MAAGHERRAGGDDFHAVGDIVHLDRFNVKDGMRDLEIRITQVSHLLWSVPDVQWIRIRGVEMDGGTEAGPVSLFVVHRDSLKRDRAEV